MPRSIQTEGLAPTLENQRKLPDNGKAQRNFCVDRALQMTHFLKLELTTINSEAEGWPRLSDSLNFAACPQLSGPSKTGAESFDVGAHVAAFEVIVDQTHCLHERIAGGRSHKRPPPRFQILRQRDRLRRRAHLHELRAREALRAARLPPAPTTRSTPPASPSRR